jgi:hypothetical protein
VRLTQPSSTDADEDDLPPDLIPRTEVTYDDPQESELAVASKESISKETQIMASPKPDAIEQPVASTKPSVVEKPAASKKSNVVEKPAASKKSSAAAKPTASQTASAAKTTKTTKKSNATAKSVVPPTSVATKKPAAPKANAASQKGSNMLKQIANTESWHHDASDTDILVAYDTPPGYEAVRDRRGNPVADWRNGQKKFRPITQGSVADSEIDNQTYPKYSKPNSNRRYDASTDSFVELTLDGDSTPVPVQTSRPSSTTSEHSANRFQVLQDNSSDDGSINVVPDSDDPKAPPTGPDFR